MPLIFALALAALGLIVALLLFPTGFDLIEEWLDNVMPTLGLDDTMTAYVSLLPYVLLALLIIGALWVLVSRK